jgi:hypothetical protein
MHQGETCVICAGKQGNVLNLQSLAEIAAQIPIVPSLAAAEAVYARRLEQCAGCEALREAVLCSHCGCFVLFRARPAQSRCPHPERDKWKI